MWSLFKRLTGLDMADICQPYPGDTPARQALRERVIGGADLPLIAEAEANIRADYRDRKISKEQFQKEMIVVTRARSQAKKYDTN